MSKTIAFCDKMGLFLMGVLNIFFIPTLLLFIASVALVSTGATLKGFIFSINQDPNTTFSTTEIGLSILLTVLIFAASIYATSRMDIVTESKQNRISTLGFRRILASGILPLFVGLFLMFIAMNQMILCMKLLAFFFTGKFSLVGVEYFPEALVTQPMEWVAGIMATIGLGTIYYCGRLGYHKLLDSQLEVVPYNPIELVNPPANSHELAEVAISDSDADHFDLN